MLQIFHNPLDAGEFETRDFDCLLAEWLALRERYPTARLYKGVACLANDITPKTVDDAWALKGLTGHYQVICHAKAPAVVAVWATVLSFAVAVYTYISMPDVKAEADTGVRGSPNNSLAQRQNKHRVGGRVPDNYGTIKALPDLISPVYRYYRGNIQVEECLLCVGAGYYDIQAHNIKEGDTPINTINGASISIYEPNQPLLSPTPQVKIGEAFDTTPLVTKQVGAVDGRQAFIPTNSNRVTVLGPIVKDASTITYTLWGNEPTKFFQSGERVTIPKLHLGAYDLSGQYTIASVSDGHITFVNPSSDNKNWLSIAKMSTDELAKLNKDAETASPQRPMQLWGTSDNYIGWYYAGSKDSTGFLLNFVAQNGIYEGDSARSAVISVEYQMVIDGAPVGEIFTRSVTMVGVANNRNTVAQTVNQSLPHAGQFRFRARRTNGNGDGSGLVDDVTFESAYSYYQSTKAVYPLDTVARLRRLAIGSGTNASELNMIASRKLDTPSGFTPTSNFADIIIAMATDPYIGRMQPKEVDAAAIRALAGEIEQYFGTAKACEFNYTFDDVNASYQEMANMVAEAVFCNARRENGQHYFAFEKRTPNSLLLFNHRNMKPDSLSVTELFGIKDNVQGIELKWRDPNDNYAEAVIKLPDDLQTNYKTIETRGVTNRVQAHLLANRAWNKLKYGRKAIEFTAYGEADLVTRMDRIAVVDSTMPILCSGEVVAQDNLHLVLDYPLPASVTIGLTIHLQLKNGVVDVIDVARVIDDYTVELARLPMQPLVTNGVSHTTFAVTKDGMSGFDAYLIESKSANSLFESSINATRYDPRYYQNDDDYKRGLITT